MYVFVPSSLSNNKIKSHRESLLGRIKKKKLEIIDKVGSELKKNGLKGHTTKSETGTI